MKRALWFVASWFRIGKPTTLPPAEAPSCRTHGRAKSQSSCPRQLMLRPNAAACRRSPPSSTANMKVLFGSGSPRMPNGKPYPSGTAYELLTALEASKAKGVPDVYVFRKTADAILPMADAERRRQAQTQVDALEAFWSEWFRSEKGEFKAAFQNFPSTDAFEQQVELLLR